MPENLVWTVDIDTCQIVGVEPSVAAGQRQRFHLTRKGAALAAYHLAGEKMNRWSEAKNAAWAVYAAECEKVTI